MSTWNHVGGGRISDSAGKHIGQFIGDFKDRDRLICAVNEIESLRVENEALKQQVEQAKRDAVPEGFILVSVDMLERRMKDSYSCGVLCNDLIAAAPKQEK